MRFKCLKQDFIKMLIRLSDAKLKTISEDLLSLPFRTELQFKRGELDAHVEIRKILNEVSLKYSFKEVLEHTYKKLDAYREVLEDLILYSNDMLLLDYIKGEQIQCIQFLRKVKKYM